MREGGSERRESRGGGKVRRTSCYFNVLKNSVFGIFTTCNVRAAVVKTHTTLSLSITATITFNNILTLYLNTLPPKGFSFGHSKILTYSTQCSGSLGFEAIVQSG